MAITTVEEWRTVPIDGFREFYEVSNLGRVRSLGKPRSTAKNQFSLRGRTLNPQISKRGYLYVWMQIGSLTRNAQVHRLVALAFIPNPANLPEVNHINLDKIDNAIDNLEWVSRLGNFLHADAAGVALMRRKLSDNDINDIRALWKNGVSQIEIVHRYGIVQGTVSRIVNGKRRFHAL